jgi:hypothetical protein
MLNEWRIIYNKKLYYFINIIFKKIPSFHLEYEEQGAKAQQIADAAEDGDGPKGSHKIEEHKCREQQQHPMNGRGFEEVHFVKELI